MSKKSDDSDFDSIFEEEVQKATMTTQPAIERFYAQIHSFPKLLGKANTIDKTLMQHFQDIRHGAVDVIEQLNKEKKSILKKFDNWLMPLAKDVLDDLLKDAVELKTDLEHSLEKLDTSLDKDWIEYAKKWTQLYAKWHDRKGITKKVLKLAEERNSRLIEKDIKVIKEYHHQALSNVNKESKEFYDLEMRLIKATADPLRHLVDLKSLQKQGELTIKQASEWIADIHKKRESFFDMVLVKIDSAAKELAAASSHVDSELSHELEGEIKFIEYEIDQINLITPKLEYLEKNELMFLNERVNCLIDHLEDYNLSNIPKELAKRLEKIENWKAETSSKIKSYI